MPALKPKTLDSRSGPYGNDGDFSSHDRLTALTTASLLLHNRFTLQNMSQFHHRTGVRERQRGRRLPRTTKNDRFLRFYNRLATAQLLLSNAQLPLLDAKRANSPQRISAANSPRPSVTIPAAEVPYAIGADRR